MLDSKREMQINDLQSIKNISQKLDRIHHPDSYRIAKEIHTYSKGNEDKILEIISRLSSNEPWEYIKGSAEFMGNNFKVSPFTLIPRVETEDLVKLALQIVTQHNINQVIDVGTGSGAIAISLALANKSVKMVATDFSKKAIEIAKFNAKALSLGGRVNFILTSLLKDIQNINLRTMIVANLPYIPTNIYQTLDPSVKDFEPQSALDGGEDGMKYINELFIQIQNLKEKPSIILLEIDPSISKTLRKYSEDIMPDYTLEIRKDFRDLDRYAILVRRK